MEEKRLHLGHKKINFHQEGNEFEPKAQYLTPGSADLCFITSNSINEVLSHLQTCNVDIIEDPAKRTGAEGPIISIYFRDPDLNLIELSIYESF